MRTTMYSLLTIALLAIPPLRAQDASQTTTTTAAPQESSEKAVKKGDKPLRKGTKKVDGDKPQWKSLLPEKGMEGWEVTDFGGEGEVKRDGEQLVLGSGDPLTGINYKKGDFPTENYEIEVEAQRVDGNDFLCGLTFPVADEFCSLIAGGWGGGVVGLSSVDGYDASENATSLYQPFDNNKWYKFRVRVDPQHITAWINDKEAIKQEREGHEFSTRIEVYVSQPLGYCAFQSQVGIRNFRWRPLQADDNSKRDGNTKQDKNGKGADK